MNSIIVISVVCWNSYYYTVSNTGGLRHAGLLTHRRQQTAPFHEVLWLLSYLSTFRCVYRRKCPEQSWFMQSFFCQVPYTCLDIISMIHFFCFFYNRNSYNATVYIGEYTLDEQTWIQEELNTCVFPCNMGVGMCPNGKLSYPCTNFSIGHISLPIKPGRYETKVKGLFL